MKDRFDTMDSNGDGFIDSGEMAALETQVPAKRRWRWRSWRRQTSVIPRNLDSMISRLFFPPFGSACTACLLHKLRSGLAVLGILIGIAAVIALVALGEGVSYQAQQQIKDLGARNVIVRSIKPPQQSSQGGRTGHVHRIRYRAFRLQSYSFKPADSSRRPFPMRELRKEVRHDAHTVEARIVGCTPQYMDVNRLTVDMGRFLTDRGQPDHHKTFACSQRTRQRLSFRLEDPLDTCCAD